MVDLTDPGSLKAFLGRHGLQADKRLGQHFLCSSRVVDAIEERLSSYRGMMEIGPGPGVITSRLANMAEKTIAIELDDRMISALGESAPGVDVRKADALKVDLKAILEELPSPRGLVSNLPYYITGPLLTRIAEVRGSYEKAVLMMQKEVADRVLAAARTSARGSLSVYLQSQFSIEKVVSAPAGAFLPPPKVDSTVLQFVPKPTGIEDEEGYFKLVRLAFTQPRKTLANNLVGGYHCSREQALEWITGSGLGELARPQELSLPEWHALWAKIAG
ncbi:MAG: ribosomal RNA small subunit methyltransferase A [Armatimonadetes bacterium 55-13]|nr:ribosomal RNA small subunit methyltransferase A [Armatimonadota bacterium]OJU61562.1 MAG: ribosomal RNA small subunit methyltransferase A [Armatimonadetes bacterium 55-13]